MGHKPSSELIQSLRATVQKIEENFASLDDLPQIAELKRIILLRIADFELVGAGVEMASAGEKSERKTLAETENGSQAG